MKKTISRIIATAMAVITMISATAMPASAAVKKNVADEAANHVGIMETTYSDGSWSTTYQDWFADKYQNGNSYFKKWAPWCAIFVCYIMNQCGGEVNVDYPATAGCNEMLTWYNQKGLYASRGSYTPQKGDLIFFNYTSNPGTTSHVGIVESSGNGRVNTIEGNTTTYNDYRYGVRRFSYSLSDYTIKGYAKTSSLIKSSANTVSNQQELVSGGIYNIQCKNGYMINVYAGYNYDGARVCMWQTDGSVEQKFKLVKKSNGKWYIYAMCSSNGNNRVLDVYRYRGITLQYGCAIDLWDDTDSPAQEVELINAGNGYYKIKLAATGHVFTACGAYNNASIMLGYDNNSAATLFKFNKIG